MSARAGNHLPVSLQIPLLANLGFVYNLSDRLADRGLYYVLWVAHISAICHSAARLFN